MLPISGKALAQPADVHAQADERFKQGIEARDKGDQRGALRLFRTSHGLEPTRGTLLNIALCEEKLGMLAAAMRHFQEVLPLLIAKDAKDPRIPVVKESIAKLEPRISYLRINLAPGAPPNARVLLDTEPMSSAVLGGNWPVDPGKHTLRIEAEGYSPATATVTVEVRKTETVNLTLERVAAGPSALIGPVPPPIVAPLPPSPAPEAASSRPIRATVGFIGIGVGGASLVMGAVTGGLTVAKRQTKCPGEKCTSTEINSYHLVGNVSTAGLVVGGVIATAGVVLVATAPGRSATKDASIDLMFGPGCSGVRGRF